MTPRLPLGVALWLGSAWVGCGGAPPQTHYYTLHHDAPAEPSPDQPAQAERLADRQGPSLALEELEAEGAYEEPRIVYRSSPYRLDYYEYHRWTSPPSVQVTDYLEEALTRSGAFAAVTRRLTDETGAVLSGRVNAFEEVDLSEARWVGRVELRLDLLDPDSEAVLWSQRYAEEEPLDVRSPEGLAEALSAALARVVARAAPEIAAQIPTP